MKSTKHAILIITLLSITGFASQTYASLDGEPEEESKASMAEHENRIKNANKLLLNGAAEGDIEKVRQALNQGANVNVKDANGRTPLHRAKSAAIVKALVNAGANLEVTDEFGITPFEALCYSIISSSNNDYQRTLSAIDVLLPITSPELKNEALPTIALSLNEDLQNPEESLLPSPIDTYNNAGKALISKLIRAGAQPFDTHSITNQALKEFVVKEFKEQKEAKEWMEAWPTSAGPATMSETLQNERWPSDVTRIVDEYLTLPEEPQEQDASAAAAAKE